jgi:hypothetical protein
MKNLIKYTSVCVVAALLFSSCGSNFSITKRHYTSGYYIDYTKSNKGVISSPIENITQVNAPVTSAAMQAPVQAINVAQAPAQSNDKNNQVVTSSNNKKQSKANLQAITKPVQVTKTGVFSNITKEEKHTLFESPNVITNSADRDDGRALSLLWLVIVIILILWLIGILAGGFGLGGLINLLLLIALILLILWLLRII